MRRFKNTLVLAAWLALVLQVSAANAQEVGTEELAPAEIVLSADQQQVVETFQGDAPGRFASAGQDVIDAQAALDAALAGGTATEEEIAALEAKLAEANSALAAVEAEMQALRDLVAQLSDEQAAALIRSLNNALASGLLLSLDTEMLQRVIDGDYDKHQIQALTQGLEQEARFMEKSARAASREGDAAGDELSRDADGSMSHAERMEQKATSEKEKFFSKIEDEPAPEATVDDSVETAVDDAIDEAIDDAVDSAVQELAKGAAKQAAKREARLLAKATAKDAVKESGKSAESNGKGHAK